MRLKGRHQSVTLIPQARQDRIDAALVRFIQPTRGGPACKCCGLAMARGEPAFQVRSRSNNNLLESFCVNCLEEFAMVCRKAFEEWKE